MSIAQALKGASMLNFAGTFGLAMRKFVDWKIFLPTTLVAAAIFGEHIAYFGRSG